MQSGTMTTPESTPFIIIGLTTQGRKFRPSDWAERLCGVMSAFGAERKMKYSPYVGPGDYNGEKAVFVDGRLEEIEPMAYRFLLNFAGDNDLQVLSGVCPVNLYQTGSLRRQHKRRHKKKRHPQVPFFIGSIF